MAKGQSTMLLANGTPCMALGSWGKANAQDIERRIHEPLRFMSHVISMNLMNLTVIVSPDVGSFYAVFHPLARLAASLEAVLGSTITG